MADSRLGTLLSTAARGFSQLPLVRQIGLLLGLSGSISLGFSMVLWLQEPNYRPLYTHLDLAATNEVADALQQNGIKYKLDDNNGGILVGESELYTARVKLAAQGLPHAAAAGFEILDKDSGMGGSLFMEDARYKRALEGELAKTISTIDGVKAARVHLAIPKPSSFLNDNEKPTASVLLTLAPGVSLERGKVAAIVQMVSSSIIGLKPNAVTITDQAGTLLTNDADDAMNKTKEEFGYQQQLESDYEKRIDAIVTPLVGLNKVHSQVSIVLDFTHHEETKEAFNPQQQVIRSEQLVKEQSTGSASSAGGAAGAASNATAGGGETSGGGGGGPSSSKDQTVHNYEVGKSIIFEQTPSGKITRLTVAVIVDDHTEIDAKTKKVTNTPLAKADLDKITELVKSAVGFDQKRGDVISVINSSFAPPETVEQLPALPMWQQPWFLDIVKKVLGVIFAVLLALGVLLPILRSLAKKAGPAGASYTGASYDGSGGPSIADMNSQLLSNTDMLKLKQKQMDSLKTMVTHDPTRVAQVLKNWVSDE